MAQKYLVGARKNSCDEVAVNSLSQVMQQRSGMCTENDDFSHLVNWYSEKILQHGKTLTNFVEIFFGSNLGASDACDACDLKFQKESDKQF